MYPYDSEEGYKKEVLFSPNVLESAEGLPNNTLLIVTDVVYKSKDGKSSFGDLIMLSNSFVCVGAHYGPKTPSSREAELKGTFMEGFL